MIADYKLRDAAQEAYMKGRTDEQTRIIQMFEQNKVALTPEQRELLEKKISTGQEK